MTTSSGKLYLVATPIGNLGDLGHRAVEILGQVDLIAAEDTRQTRHLLAHYAISSKLVSVHDHNEHRMVQRLVERMAGGESVALVSDAGTPLINDPGFELLNAAVDHGLCVIPVPGPCALVAALSVSGLATDRFGFYGFPPRNSAARQAFFQSLVGQLGTLVFYESCHRIIECLNDCAEIFPVDRSLVVCRELTKAHETIIRTQVGDVISRLEHERYIDKGELVLLIEGRGEHKTHTLLPEHVRMIEVLLADCSVKRTAELVAEITGLRRKLLYQAALEIKNRGSVRNPE